MDEPYARRWEEYRAILGGNPPMARLVEALAPDPEDPVEVVAGAVLGPALGAFTRWLLGLAQRRGWHRLYFLARDGYLFRRGAKLLGGALGLDLDCRYLCCSRRSLALPLFHRDPDRALAYLCRNSPGLTLDRVLGRAGLGEGERQEIIKELRLPFLPGELLPRRALPQVRQALARCGAFRRAVEEGSRRALPGLTGYLEQEGLLEDVPFALVDSGWMGSLQQSLQEALACLGKTGDLEGCYWGLYQVPSPMDRERYHCYDFAPEGPLEAKVYFNNCLFEAVFTAPHGTTLGYRQEGGFCRPVYGPAPRKGLALRSRLEAGVMAYLEELAKGCSREGLGRAFREDRETVRRLLGAFMARPWPQEARIFGALPFSDGGEGEEEPLAGALTPEELELGHGLGRLAALAGRGEPRRESAWPQGSAVLYSADPRGSLRRQTWYQYLRLGWAQWRS